MWVHKKLFKPNSYWLSDVPWGLYRAITYVKERYMNPTVVISENGKPRT